MSFLASIGIATSDIIAFYDDRAASISAAKQQIAGALKLGAKSNRVSPQQGGDRQLTLEYVVRGQSTIALALTTAPAGDYFAQSVSVTKHARQSVHQTAVGFYVDEFNESPGELEIDAIVVWNEVIAWQYQQLFDLLDQAKQTTPFDNTPPVMLRFHDTYTSGSFVITQNDMHVEETIERPGMARFSLHADILYDYNSPAALAQQASNLETAIQATTTALQSNLVFSSGTGGGSGELPALG